MSRNTNTTNSAEIYEDINSAPRAKRGRPKLNKRGRPKLTMKQRLMAILNRSGDFLSLPEIYNKMGAQTLGERAGIRGILNRSVADRDGEFVRKAKSTGLYKTKAA